MGSVYLESIFCILDVGFLIVKKYFDVDTLNKGLNLLLVQWKWLGWKNNKAELFTTDAG